MSFGKAVKWKFAGNTKPSSKRGNTVYNLLLCSVYNGYPDGDVEHFYTIGRYHDGKFYDEKGKRYHADYWAAINEPHAWECDPPVDVFTRVVEKQQGICGPRG